MAYTIISQNNTTTTLSDENGNVITVPARVTLATSTDYTIIKVNNNSVDLESGDGKIIRGVPACVVLAGEGGGGGGSVDYAKTVQRAETMPTADSSNAGQQFLYSGESDATYTHGYIYENVKSATYTGTVSFEAATLSGTTVTCSGDNFATFLTEAGADPTPIVSGTMTFESDANGWRLVGKDSNDNTVTTFIEYVEDYEDAGFVFTGTPQDNDVIAFTCTVEEASATYTWTRIDVQPNGGNYLPLSGGTMTGDIKFESGGIDGGYIGAQGGYIRIGSGATPSNDDLYFSTKVMSYGATGGKIGTGQFPIDTVYAQKLNNGADIAVPTTGGTMAVIGVNTTATLAVADWSSNTQTVTVSGVKADGVVFVSPDPTSASDYASAGILCTAQAADSLTFTATTTPSVAIDVDIVCL